MKKIVIYFLLMVILIQTVYASKLPTISVGSFSAYENEEFEVPLILENNPGFSAIGFKITFDTEKLEYIDSTVLHLKNAMMKGITNDGNLITFYALSPDRLIDDNGTVGKIKFKAKKSISNLLLEAKELEIYDENKEPIEMKTSNAVIEIARKAEINNKIDLNEIINDKENNINNSYENLIWSSSNENIATVDDGVVSFKKAGEVVINATDEDGNIILEEKFKIPEDNNKDINSSYLPIAFIGGGVIIILILFITILKKKRYV